MEAASPIASGSKPSPKRDRIDPDELFGDTPPPDDVQSSAPTTPSDPDGNSHVGTPEGEEREAREGSGGPDLEYPEEDEGPALKEANIATVMIPNTPNIQATDGKVWHMKLPAYVNFESQPFDPDLYRAGLVKEDVKLDNTKKRSKMIRVRNTMRWKWITGSDGEPTRQSNSRFLRWSDGSMSLQLGSDLFDLTPSYGTTLARPSDQTLVPSTDDSSSTTFLCEIHRKERVVMVETPVEGQISVVPTSMTSKTHLELVKHVGQTHAKHSRMKLLDDVADKAAIEEMHRKAAGIKPKSTKRSTKSSGRKNRKRGYSISDDERKRDYDEDDGFVVADDDDESDAAETDSDAYDEPKRKRSLDAIEKAERRIDARERLRKRAKKRKEEVSEDEEDPDDGGEAEISDED